MGAEIGRKSCKRNDSFFENAGKLYESPTMMWIKYRRRLRSRGINDSLPKSPPRCQTVEESSRHRISR
jgi:hypothetical protein